MRAPEPAGHPERTNRGGGIEVSVLSRRVARAFRSAALTAALTVLLALINPVPAAAHIVGTGGSPTNYRAAVTAIRPALPAVAATVGLGGQFVRITNQVAATIGILGYRGEPFLRLSAHLVEVNQLSGTAAQTGLIPVAPPPESSASEPRWVRSSDADSVAWTDARIAPPPPGIEPLDSYLHGYSAKSPASSDRWSSESSTDS